MNKTDKIAKSTTLLIDSAKDNTNKNVINYVRTNKLLDEKQLQNLVQLINVSISEGHQLALRTFQKSIDNLLNEK
jgi:hypothetical protein